MEEEDKVDDPKSNELRYLRYRAVVWSINDIDIETGHFGVKIRFTLWWRPAADEDTLKTILVEDHPDGGRQSKKWKLQGRKEATFQRDPHEETLKEKIPEFQLFETSHFAVEGNPEVHCIETRTGRVLLRWTSMYTATFKQGELYRKGSELRMFPFDSHDLKIWFGVNTGAFEQMTAQPATEDDNLKKLEENDAPECALECDRETADFLIHPKLLLKSVGVDKHPNNMLLVLKIWRKPQYYEQNIFGLNAAMTFMSFTAYTFELHEFEPRTQVLFSVLFGIVALRFIVDEHCPKLEYKTCAQKHLNVSIYFIVLIVIESAVLFVIDKYDRNYSDVDDAPIDVGLARQIDLGFLIAVLLYFLYDITTIWGLSCDHLKVRPDDDDEGSLTSQLERRLEFEKKIKKIQHPHKRSEVLELKKAQSFTLRSKETPQRGSSSKAPTSERETPEKGLPVSRSFSSFEREGELTPTNKQTGDAPLLKSPHTRNASSDLGNISKHGNSV